MKRNLFIGLLILITIFSLIFSYFQKKYVEDNLKKAEINRRESLKLKAELELKINILQEKLSDCQSSD